MSRLVSTPRADRLGSVRRFDPQYWTTDFNLQTSGSIVTSGAGLLERQLRGVTLIPGTTEFGYSTTRVRTTGGEDQNFRDGSVDLVASLDQLQAAVPEIEHVSLVVAWHGDDLRCGECEIRPRVENASKTTVPYAWQVGPVTRDTAVVVSQVEGVPSSGSAPADRSVYEAIREIKRRGLRVTLYPFILMDVPAGNSLANPYGGSSQPAYPWRGRITCHPAPGQVGTVDKTSTAATQVAAFFGTAAPSDFGWSTSGQHVTYSGPDEWSFRRFVLHLARLAVAAGGVDAFLIGSEMVGLTTVRSSASAYPAVSALVTLAAAVRTLVGSATKISYAADWSEYHSHRPGDGSGDLYFHLDPLWASADIDFVGIDNYMPLADWRDGSDHLDAEAGARSQYDMRYLQSNVEGGEYFDWYYASQEDRDDQVRSPITDGGYGKPWVYRNKAIRDWWANAHKNRPAGVEAVSATAWVPQGKPIRFTEVGCPAIDKGANQPNVFVDAKSSESQLPHFSSGDRDDRAQRAFLEATLAFWRPNAGNNPASAVYAGRMLDWDTIAVWTWDARPYPAFPDLDDLWADGENWALGHWLTGRLGDGVGVDVHMVARRHQDISGAIWLTEHRFDHPSFRYAAVPDYTGTVLEFTAEVVGEGAPLAGVLGPSLTMTTTGGTDHFVRLWRYRKDTTDNNVWRNRFRIVFDGTLRAGFNADGAVVPVTDIARILLPLVPRDYQGGTTCTLQTEIVQGGTYATIAVRVPGGRQPVAGDVLSIWPGTLAADDHVQLTVASAVAAGGGYPADTFIITPTVALSWPWANTIPVGAQCQISTSQAAQPLRAANTATLKLRDIVVTGPRALLLADERPLPAHGIAMTDGWDNAYPLTPALVVDRCLQLGYRPAPGVRQPFVFYVGISHFHSFVWDPALERDGATGGWVIDPDLPAINDPTALWLSDFAARLAAVGIDLWISVSFEILNSLCPPAWRQLDAEGNPALTGWSPPSTLVSVANTEALDYLAAVATAFLDVSVAAGQRPLYQIGEPWHWVTVYEPGNATPLPNPADWAPCIYDPALEAAYVAETGLSVPTPRLTSVVVDDATFAANAAYFAFCRESLGAATLTLTAAVTADHPAVETALLLFTPQVLSDVARVLPAINRPLAAQWGPANFDVLMLEHYDWAIEGAFEKFALTWAFATAELGWPLDRLYHFVGFVLDGEDAALLWPRIDVDLADALSRGPAQVFVWSREQVWRDGWLYEAPIELTPAPSLPDPLAAPAIDAFVPSIHASLPLGPAWRTPDRAAFDEDSWMGRFWRAVADPFVRLYADAWGVKEEAAAPSLSAASLPDWEQELRLPDPCTGLGVDFAARKTAVREKLVAAAVMRPADFVALAARLGWTVTVEEPRGFEAGHSQCGWDDELSDIRIEFQPVFRIANAEATAFELAEAECGVTAITDFRLAADLVCRVREVLGADLEPGFHYRDASAPPRVLGPPPLAATMFETAGESATVAGIAEPFALVEIEI